MSKRKRGMSLEEKRQTMLEIITQAGEPFDLKELEKKGSKAGVVSQAIKDVVQSLFDDNLIEAEKVGIKKLFWAFPTKQLSVLRHRIATFEERIAADRDTIATLEGRAEALSEGAEAAASREAKMSRLAELDAEIAELQQQVDAQKDRDPAVLRELEELLGKAKEGCDRWTDGVFSMLDVIVKKYGRSADEFWRMMELSADFDYVEL